LVKAAIWAIGLGSGTSGGLVAPLLLMGSALGALGATVFHAADPGLWAMIGMAALMGGTMQIPVTAIVFALELTGDVAALPALLIACVASEAVTLLVLRRSILTEKLARRGRHLTRDYGVNPLRVLQVEDVMEPPLVAPAAPDVRVLTLTLLAAVIGVVSAFVALALVRLIGLFTHLFYYHEIAGTLVSPAANRLGAWAVAVPVGGGLVVGLMARYGSERIRGHGIPEALEAILIGRSRMAAKVAILKPLSSA